MEKLKLPVLIKSSRPHFLWVYWCDNLLGMLGEHLKSLEITRLWLVIHKLFLYKRINGYLPNYLNEHLILNNDRQSRNTRYSSINAVCPKYIRETEGGRSFAVSATRLWNSIPIEIRKLDSVACFKKNMFAKIFNEQQCLHHFIIWSNLVLF